MASSNGKQNNGPSRTRYWQKHEKPQRKIIKVPGLQKRVRASEYSLMQTVADLGAMSDVAVVKNAPNDLVRNRAFVEHQQKLRGAIGRLAQTQIVLHSNADQVAKRRVDGRFAIARGEARIPHRAEMNALKSAFKTLDVHYAPCGKVKRCKLSDGHIGSCKEVE